MDLRLLQYNVGSHSRKGEVIKQQLVQTALQQGLCDLALIQGCTGIHEPIRAGAGAVYQPAFSSSGPVQSNIDAGTLFCYTANRFKVRQLSSSLQDLPGCQHSILLLEDITTRTNFIALVLSTDTSTQQQQQPLHNLWKLMQELSTQCPVLAAGECTTSTTADPLCTDPRIQLHVCQPVHSVSSISQSFFASACTPPHDVHITDVQSLLARPATAAVQYTHNAHTAACRITCSASMADDASALGVGSHTGVAMDSMAIEEAGSSTASTLGSDVIAGKLRALVNAASMGMAEVSSTVKASEGSSNEADTWHQPGTRSAADSRSQPVQLSVDRTGRSIKQAAPSPLAIACHNSAHQAAESEIEPKPPTPAHVRPGGGHQLTQTSSGNLCFAGLPSPPDDLHETADGTQLQTPTVFQLQPKPTGQQHVDINALRIMQLKRSISELSSGSVAPDSAISGDAAAMTAELHAMLHQQRHEQQLSQPAATDRTGSLDNVQPVGRRITEEDEENDAIHSGSGTDAEDDGGLYAAAKQAPGELKAAWNKLVQQPTERKGMRRQLKGRSSEDRISSPGRLLKCLQSKTGSDVEAQMEAMHFKH